VPRADLRGFTEGLQATNRTLTKSGDTPLVGEWPKRILALALCAIAALVVAGSAASYAPRKQVATLGSKGCCKQGLRGGGLVYGTISWPGSVLVQDYVGDAVPKVPGVKKRILLTGGVYFKIPFKKKKFTFSVTGTRYRIVVEGKSTMAGVGVYGKALFLGQGTYSLNGAAPLPWPNGVVDLGRPNAPPPTTSTVTTTATTPGSASAPSGR
jgi:hypothetical protein